jgi:hypothetical protein
MNLKSDKSGLGAVSQEVKKYRRRGGATARDTPYIARGAAGCGKPRNFLIGNLRARAAQAGAEHADRIARGNAPALEALGERHQVFGAEGGFQLGQRAERET